MTVNQQVQANPTGKTAIRNRPVPASEPGDNLFSNYLRIFREFRRHDLIEFCDQHARMYRDAIDRQNHLAVTQHYYGLMADVIETYYGDGWHFCPPEFRGQSRADATRRMYRRVIDLLQLRPDSHVLDLGCGVGGMLRFVARHTAARLSGITLGENEVQQANRLIDAQGLADRCRVVQGDSQAMPFESNSFDGVYAVYSLKYYSDLNPVLGEIYRVLRPGGRLVAYCLCKSKQYRDDQPAHRKLVNDFEFSTAMPPLNSVRSIIAAAKKNNLTCVTEEDLSQGSLNWYSYWVGNPLLPWAVSSRLVYGLARSAEAVRILPRGFARFNDTFLAGTLRHIIRAGKTGVLTGSALLSFEKRDQS